MKFLIKPFENSYECDIDVFPIILIYKDSGCGIYGLYVGLG